VYKEERNDKKRKKQQKEKKNQNKERLKTPNLFFMNSRVEVFVCFVS